MEFLYALIESSSNSLNIEQPVNDKIINFIWLIYDFPICLLWAKKAVVPNLAVVPEIVNSYIWATIWQQLRPNAL